MANENAQLAEFANNLWENYLKQKHYEASKDLLSYYRAEVVSNDGNNKLTIQRPYDNSYQVNCTEDMNNIGAGEQVTVVKFGNGANNKNHLVVADGSGNQTGASDVWYGTCDTAAGTAAKVVDCAGFVLKKSRLVVVQFSTANTVGNTITLNVNGTGAKPIMVFGNTTSTSYTLKWNPYEVLTFVYDGSAYRLVARNAPLVNARGITWKTPTIVNNSCTILLGGYMQEGHHVYVHCAIRPTAALAANANMQYLNGFPPSLSSLMPINCLCNYYVSSAYIGSQGEFVVRASSSSGVSTSQNIWISGTYIASTFEY